MAELGEVLSRQKDGLKKIVGLDVEWKPGAKPLVATLQLSVASGYTVVIHFTQFLPRKSYKAGTRMDIPLTIATLAPLRTLKRFLEDRSITKVGVCAAGDRTRLLHSMDIDIEGILEIGNFAVTNNVLSHATMGLEDLILYVFDKQLPKPELRMSDWNLELSPQQLTYAATDSFAVISLYAAFLEKRNTIHSHFSPDKVAPCQDVAIYDSSTRIIALGTRVAATTNSIFLAGYQEKVSPQRAVVKVSSIEIGNANIPVPLTKGKTRTRMTLDEWIQDNDLLLVNLRSLRAHAPLQQQRSPLLGRRASRASNHHHSNQAAARDESDVNDDREQAQKEMLTVEMKQYFTRLPARLQKRLQKRPSKVAGNIGIVLYVSCHNFLSLSHHTEEI